MKTPCLLLCAAALFSAIGFSAESQCVARVAASAPIVVQGTALIDSGTGQRFFAHGAGYDYTVTNAFEASWRPAIERLLRDAPLVNSLRIYVIDPTAQYDKFLDFIESKNLYVIIAVTPSSGCVLSEFGTPTLDSNTCYPSCLLSYGQGVINQFAVSNNVLAFMVGNEVMRDQAR